jgi:hypothetical protein
MAKITTSRRYALLTASVASLLGLGMPAHALPLNLGTGSGGIAVGPVSIGSGGISVGGGNLLSLGTGAGAISVGTENLLSAGGGAGGIVDSGAGGISLGSVLGSGSGGISLGGGQGLVSVDAGAASVAVATPDKLVDIGLDAGPLATGGASVGMPSFSGDHFLSAGADLNSQLLGARATADVGALGRDGLVSADLGLSLGGTGGANPPGGNPGGDNPGGPTYPWGGGGGGGGGVAIGGFSASYASREDRISCDRVLKTPRYFAKKVVRYCKLAREHRRKAERRSAHR